MSHKRYIFIGICLFVLTGQVLGYTEITGGWDVAVNGEGATHGAGIVSGCGGDPSVTLAITSTSSLYGPGVISDYKCGSQSLNLPVGGYELAVEYEGEVSSSLSLFSQGSAATRAFIGATATGISTGGDSHDIFGSADLTTDGYICGQGIGEASAKGSSSYKVVKIGTPSEVWGEASGESKLRLEGRSPDALASTGGAPNGLHTESRVTKTILGEESASSVSRIFSDASVINNARVNVSSSGTAQGGAWGPSFVDAKEKLGNEDVASSVTGELWGYSEANGNMDAADVSSVLQAIASKDDSKLYVSGGPASYAASTQSSSAARTYSETWVENAIWGSVVRTNDRKTVVEWGNLSDLGSGAHVYEPGANAISFGKILMKTDYFLQENRSTGNMSLDTYAEASAAKVALAGTSIGPTGDGTMRSSDDVMSNEAGYEGGLDHFSFIDAGREPYPWAETRALLTRAYVTATPSGFESLNQPFLASTLQDPYVAWSRTEGYYEQAH